MATRLLPGPETVHFGFFDGSLEPVLEVDDGAVLAVRAVSGHPDDPVPREWIPPEIPPIYEQVAVQGPGPHIVTGPVAVRGAEPGMVLEVEIGEHHPGRQREQGRPRDAASIAPRAPRPIALVSRVRRV